MNEVRLVEVAARCCNIRPVWSRSASSQISRALKALYPSKLLWCDADLFCEDVYKMALAQPELPGKVSSSRFARISSKDVQSSANCSMLFRRVLQTSKERLFQDLEA